MFGFNLTEYDKKVYEKELKNFLPDKIFDAHVHIWKKEFAPYGSHNGGSTWTDMVAEDLTVEDLMQTMKDLFPDKKVEELVFGGVLHDLDETNEYVRISAEKYGFKTLYRSDYAMDADDLESKVKQGGFLGLKPYISNSPSYIPSKEVRILDFLPESHLQKANKNGWIIMLHIPRDDRLKDRVNLEQIKYIESKYPNVKLIVAHVGRAYAKEDFGDAFKVLKETKNMYFDFTANLLDLAITEGIKTVGVDRFIFGSDLPIAKMRMYRIVKDGVYFNVVPKGLYGKVEGEPHMLETEEKEVTNMLYEQILAFKRSAKELKLTDTQVEKVLYGNIRKLVDAVK